MGCLSATVDKPVTSNGTPFTSVVLTSCGATFNSAAQQWTYDPATKQVVNAFYNQCLSTTSDKPVISNGDAFPAIVLAPCGSTFNTAAQQWTYDSTSKQWSNVYYSTAPQTGGCMSATVDAPVTSGGKAYPAPVINTCGHTFNATAQQWTGQTFTAPPLPPTIATNPNVQVLQTTPTGTPVSFASPAASDPNTGGALTSTCSPASGTTFPVGATTVTCSVTEPEGLSASSHFTVTVKPVVSSCESRALGFDGARSLSLEQANPATTPCAPSSGALLVTSATLAPGGFLGIGSIRADGSLLKSSTTAAFGATAATDSATDTIVSISFIAPGISLKTGTVTAQASSTLGANCAGTTTGSSDIEGLVINGKHYTIGTASLTIPLGLGLELNLNQKIVTGNVVTVRAFSITSINPNSAAYHTVIGEAVAGLTCG
ncbi:MAG TPA: choice-of-anchor P family protein [Marmoricola sp.]|nr:choice-of-anchor P family protein [Marmoricola sp.]